MDWGRIGTTLLTTLLLLSGDDARAQHDVEAAVKKGVQHLLVEQEGEGPAEWPYEGVYRVRAKTGGREIPIGYRIGGTSIVAMSLVQAPGYAEDDQRKAAVERAVGFVCEGVEHPLMTYERIRATYDVRGWGYAYGLWFLCRLKAQGLVPKKHEAAVEKAIPFYLAGIAKTEIPRYGGWNYSRRGGFDRPGFPSPFMIGSTLQALFEAKGQGYEVDAGLVDRGLQALQRARTVSGSYVYSGWNDKRMKPSPTPGATGRMLIAETTLVLAGKGSPILVRGALDAFFVHWEWLNKRRAKTGTHIPPYGIAPYYFYFAHHYAAQAIEVLPSYERAEYRRRLRDTIFSVRLPNGTWNDRVFKRSACYGTAMVMMALGMETAPKAARWSATTKRPRKKKKQKDFK